MPLRARVGPLLRKALMAAGMGSVIGCASKQSPPAAAAEPSARASMADRMRDTVRKLSVDLVPRDFSHPELLDEAASHIAAKLRGVSGNVREQRYEVGGVTYKNVIADLGPDTREKIVVGAHYDAVESTPGADDNASAVAGLIELAALLSRDPLPMRVECVAYTLEEPPHFGTPQMGSAHHASALAGEEAEVVAAIVLEMIGYYDDRPGSQSYPVPGMQLVYGTVGDFISVVGRTDQVFLVNRVARAMREAAPLRVEKIAAPAFVAGIDFSDHRNYWQHGFSAVMVTDTAFYRNEAYHLAGDTMDRLDFDRMVDVVLGVRAAVLDLAAEGATRPR